MRRCKAAREFCNKAGRKGKGSYFMTEQKTAHQDFLALTADIVSSHVANNTVAVSDLPGLIQNVYTALAKLSGAAESEKARQDPAVSIRASVKPDFIRPGSSSAALSGSTAVNSYLPLVVSSP